MIERQKKRPGPLQCGFNSNEGKKKAGVKSIPVVSLREGKRIPYFHTVRLPLIPAEPFSVGWADFAGFPVPSTLYPKHTLGRLEHSPATTSPG